ncbi:MAG TPA: thiamine pyrophosphate-binding protein [Dehalococcoidia bacterium]|nr:thiamine pyrophosphate-binding protein [Dehalococcoidia bacterium]
MQVGERLAALIAGGGVNAMFGVPGGQTMPLYGAAAAAGLQHVLMRDERGAACAADAYARLSGRVGFCDATVGPGVTNLVSGVAEAYASSIPIVAVIADIRSDQMHLRRRASVSQAMDQAALLAPITKWFGRVERPDSLDAVFDQAIRIATTGRPGPVVVEIPDDVFGDAMSDAAELRTLGPAEFAYPRFRSAPTTADLERAVRLLAGAERPLILTGGGVTFSDASEAVSELAERHQIPVVTTISGKGTIVESSPLAAGVTGVFGTRTANSASLAADLVLVIGCKLGQLTTHGWSLPRRDQQVIHIDVDGEEIGRAIPATLGIVADAREAARCLTAALSESNYTGTNWLVDLDIPEDDSAAADGAIQPEALAGVLSDALREDDVLVCDASLSSGWGAAHVPAQRHRSFVAPRGLAGIGWGAGAAIGARMAVEPTRRVVVLAGDGAWGYSLSEVETATRLGVDITYIILNNSGLGWIKHGEDYRGHEEKSLFSDVDFAGVARSMGAGGSRVTNLEDFESHLHAALEDPQPHLVDVVTSLEATPVLSLSKLQRGSR